MSKLKKDEFINVISPKPYEVIGSLLSISGWVSRKWLEYNNGNNISNSLFLDLIDINGKTFMGGSTHVIIDDLPSKKEEFQFQSVIRLDQFSIYFLVESQGRITIKLNGQQKEQSIFIPIIVDGFEPENGVDPEIVKKHSIIDKTVKKYEKDIEDYIKKIDLIYKKREEKNKIKEEEYIGTCVEDRGVLWELSCSLDDLEKDEKYIFYEEDLEERRLEEKYKDAIEWAGPFCSGMAGAIDGFKFIVYSDDHDKHFHVIHRGRGINARFSFPNIKLINYKNNKNVISSKEIKKIINCFKNPELVKRVEGEFQKRDSKNET